MPIKPIPKNISTPPNQDAINKWFNEFISFIQADHFMMTEGAASEETKKFYNQVISGNEVSFASDVREASSKIFIRNIVNDYLHELQKLNKKPASLSLGLSDSKILVWAVIEDDDEATEDALLISEAKVNGKYYKHGFYLNSTIIEKSDKIPTPPHYNSIIE